MTRPRTLLSRKPIAGALAFALVGAMALTAIGQTPYAGPQGDGTSITPQGWHVTPAGTQTDLGPGTLDLAMSPSGNLLLAVNAGYLRHSLMVIDPDTGRVLQKIRERGGHNGGAWQYEAGHSDGYYVGVAFSPDGRTAWASSGSGDKLHVFTVTGQTLDQVRRIRLASNLGNDRVYPAGIAVNETGSRLYVAGNLSDSLLAVNPATRAVVGEVSVGHLPYGVALNQAGTRAFVSNWGANTVSVVNTKTMSVVHTVAVGTHPSAITTSATRAEIYVANTDSDSVSVLDGFTGAVLRSIDLRPFDGAPIGASPNALTTSPDGDTLYVTNAGDNDVAVIDLAAEGSTKGDVVDGLIPTAWYPSGVITDPSGGTLFVTNMKGLGVGPNNVQGLYWPTLLRGSLSRIAVPGASKLASYTAKVRENDRFDAPPVIPSGSVIPASPGDPTPITHVIYVMKENRTYDQILGDLEVGNGDPSLAIFGADITPNHHELARRFVTFDNFYADAEVSADGWSWTTGAYANAYIQKNWPLDYNYYGRPYDFGGFGEATTAGLPGEDPGRGFLWDELARAGIDYRNFGFFVDNPVDLQPSIPGLLGHTDLQYPGWDLSTPDQVRIDRWLQVFGRYQRQQEMPTMQFVYLPSDHTAGTTPKARNPDAMVADNDLALGKLVDAVSHSSFWASTAIFVIEDDAQDGPDHVDGHRSIAYAISPYTQTATVDSTFYSGVSVMRTMELILGVPPLTQFDALATPMTAAFTTTPNLQPYDALVPGQDLTAVNTADSPMASESTTIDFSEADAIPMRLMNEILWANAFGEGSVMPEPVHSLTVEDEG